MDPVQLREAIRNAARLAFTNIQSQHPEESFYTFALQSLDDATGVYAHANTQAGYLKSSTRCPSELNLAGDGYYRWYWGEWAYTNIEQASFHAVYDMLNGPIRESWSGEVSELRGTVFASMVAVLSELDGGGIFGSGADRDRITLFCTVEDSRSCEWVEEESVARLNSPAIYSAFTGREISKTTPLVRAGTEPDHTAFVRCLDEWGIPRRA